jgi:hypothetical protein
MKTRRAALIVGALLITTLAGAQLGQIIKVAGVGAAVSRFGPDINKGFNQLTKWKDTPKVKTKVVPIITGGIGSRKGIGAAQVMGPPAEVDKVKSVAQLEQSLFGEIRIQALIPISSDRIVENIRRVDGVGVSGVVDLRL